MLTKALGWVITRGTMEPCFHCLQSKAKQKNVQKKSENEKSTKPCKRLYLDLTKVMVPKKDGGEHTISRKQWRNFVDEVTGKKWCNFTIRKGTMSHHGTHLGGTYRIPQWDFKVHVLYSVFTLKV